MHKISFSTNNETEPTFQGNDFCQWLLANHFVEDEISAKDYLKHLIENKQIFSINQTPCDEEIDAWYAFSK